MTRSSSTGPSGRAPSRLLLAAAAAGPLLSVAGLAHAQGLAPPNAPSQSAVPDSGGIPQAAVPGAPTTEAPTTEAAQALAGPAQASTVGEVVVTAAKRAQNLQDVPIAVQAVSGQQLRAEGVVAFTDLTRVAPSLVIRPAEQPVNADISIRGIGTFAYSIGVEPSVAIQIDDVPVAFQARAFADLDDVARVEVLRGPQSTLYGKSASAGLINIYTEQPTSTFSGRLDTLFTGDGERNAGGAVSGPITDTLDYRVSVNYDAFDGNVKNVYDNQTVNGHEYGSIYGKLAWKPIEHFRADLGLDYIDGSTTVGRPFLTASPKANLRANPADPPSVWDPGIAISPDNMEVSNNVRSGTQYDGFSQSLKLTYDLPMLTLLSITSHDHFLEHDRLDQDESALPAYDNRQTGAFGATEWTQELRLVSPSHQRFRYTGGVFYASESESRDFTRGPVYSTARWLATFGGQQEAVYGQFDYDILPRLTFTGGARYQHEDINYTFLDILNHDAFYSGSNPDSFVTWKSALQYKLTPRVMLYTSYATGHKGETYDLSTGFNLNREKAGPVLPETSDSYEVGARTQFFQRRLTLNLTAFNAIYRNFQAQGIETLPDGTVNYRLANVGRIHTRGIELDSAAQIRDLTLGLSAAYLDATISSFPLAQCYPLQTVAEGCTGSPAFQNLAGARPPQSPRWKLTANFDYHHALPNLPFEGVVQGVYSYQSTVNYSLSQDPQTTQPAYAILNLSAGVRDPVRHYQIMAFVNNALNQHYFVDLYNSASNYGNVVATQGLPARDTDRYAGVRASYTF